MGFKAPRKPPQFADLKVILAQTRETEDPLYQVVQEIIERLASFQFDPLTGTEAISGGGPGGGGGGASAAATYLTRDDETTALPQSIQLLARYGLKFDDSVLHKRTIDLDLEYLGNFTTGPLYSDGDVVVGPDNIAYLCVRPTNDPPVMWPGVGMATAVGPPGPAGPPGPPGINSGIDATYWTVTPHADLVNERALNGLGVGYVRSTSGEPSVVATIPLTDTTGILPDNRLTSNVALKNINNNFVAQTFASFSRVQGTNSAVVYYDIGSGVDLKVWRTLNYNEGNFHIEALNDAESVALVRFSFARTGHLYAGYFVGDGQSLTNLDAAQLSHGTVPIGRLGTNAPNASTFLRGDNTWAPISGGDSFPSGMIAIALGPCPVGWTRVALDNYFLRVGTPGTTGGAWTHTHERGSYQVDSHNHGGSVSVSVSGNTSNQPDHQHGFNVPVNVDTSFENTVDFNADAGASGLVARDNHRHNVAFNYIGDTNPAGGHSHSFSGGGSGGVNLDAPNVHGTSAEASSLPPHYDINLCQKN